MSRIYRNLSRIYLGRSRNYLSISRKFREISHVFQASNPYPGISAANVPEFDAKSGVRAA